MTTALAAGLLLLGATAQAGVDDSEPAGRTINIDQRPCHSDMNNDGYVGFFELNMLLMQWGTCEDRNAGPGIGNAEVAADRCSADLDGNGVVGFIDMNYLINAWGECDTISLP